MKSSAEYDTIDRSSMRPGSTSESERCGSAADDETDAWVFGVEVSGVARAYSLNLLNHHEVVNDRVGDTAFAAVW